jgi:hypothetical protein
MIWILISSFLYLLISVAALAIICEGERQAYYDIRNIGTALFWPVVLIGAGLVWVVRKLGDKQKPEQDAK